MADPWRQMALLSTDLTVTETPLRELALRHSASGRRRMLLELHEYADDRVDAYELSGWLSPAQAAVRQAELMRSGCWLSPQTILQMNAGCILPVAELRWQVGGMAW